ncbi:MAG: DMT family transporter [Acidobacteriota bacterium]
MPKWLMYSTVSMLIWAIWSLLSPIASRDLSGSMIQILSSAGLIPFAFLLLFSKNLKSDTYFGKGTLLALATGVTGGAGNIMLYRALGHNGPASLVFPIISIAPLIPVLAAPVLFKEKIRRLQAFGIAVALIAILLLNTSPSPSPAAATSSLLSEWMLYTLLALLIFGITFITQKGATYFISDELSTVAYTVGFVLLDFFLLLTDRSLSWNIPAKAGWVSVVIGILMGVGSLTLFAAYRHGKASIVTPFSQLYPIITVLVAVPLYHESIDLLRGIGIVAALAAGVILSIENTDSRAAPL